MRELAIFELEMIGGGKKDGYVAYTDGINIGAGIGGGAASMFHRATGDFIARGAGRGGMVGFAGAVGWNIGTYLYHETRVGDWVNRGVDKVTGLDKIGRSNRNR